MKMDQIQLTEICTPKQWKTIPTSALLDSGYPVYGANGRIGYYNEYNHEHSVVAITCRGATCGTIHITEPQAYITGNAMCLDNLRSDIDPRYLYYALLHYDFKKVISGSAQPQITRQGLEKVSIVIGTAQYQLTVIETLEKAKELINARQRELQTLDELVKARFVEMFGMPVTNNKAWKTELMENVAPAVNYTGHFNNHVWLLNLDMVEAQTGRILDHLIVSENEVGNSTCTFDTSNVLYSKLRPYLNKVVIPDRCGYATSEFVPLQPVITKLTREYLAFMLRSDEFVNMINDKVAGAKMPRVSMNDFRRFEVPIPPLKLQKQFSAFVAQVDKSKAVVQKALDKAQLLFDSLMQQYFG